MTDVSPTLDNLPPLITWGDPRLAKPSAPVPLEEIPTAAFQRRLSLLRLGLETHGANGIAAPQLGWFQRYFLMRDPAGGDTLIYWINPEVTATTEEMVWYWEGCLSVPGYQAFVGRAAAIAVHGYDAQGAALSREFTGWEAHLFQHEFDHLDGILFPDRVADMRHMVTNEALKDRAQWPKHWPAPGAHDAPQRVIRPQGNGNQQGHDATKEHP